MRGSARPRFWPGPRQGGRPRMRTHVARPFYLGIRAALLDLAGFAPSTACADLPSTPALTYGTDGTVDALARLGNTIYLGGQFSNVGPTVGGGAALSTSDGT